MLANETQADPVVLQQKNGWVTEIVYAEYVCEITAPVLCTER